MPFGGTMTVDPTISEEHRPDEALVNENPALNPTVGTTRVSGLNADREVDAPDGAAEGSKFVEQDFYNPHDGTKGRPGGIYLDVQERQRAEEIRAKSEGREPNYDNPPAVAGTTLVTDAMRVDNSLYSNPGSDPVAPVKEVEPVLTAPIDVGVAATETDTSVLEQQLDEANARNDAVNGNEPTGDTAEEGATPENQPENQSADGTTSYQQY
jgi:hypothetical protein